MALQNLLESSTSQNKAAENIGGKGEIIRLLHDSKTGVVHGKLTTENFRREFSSCDSSVYLPFELFP